MNNRDLDNYITGHYGEYQFRNEDDGANDWPEPPSEPSQSSLLEEARAKIKDCQDNHDFGLDFDEWAEDFLKRSNPGERK